MKIYLRGLTMTAVLLSTTATLSAAPQYDDYYGGYVGDDSASEDRSHQENGRVIQVSASARVGDEPSSGFAIPASSYSQQAGGEVTFPTHEISSYPQMSAGDLSMGAVGHSYSPSTPCDANFGKMSKLVCGKSPDVWLQAETLLWFPQSRRTPPLVAVAPAGDVPFLPGATVVADEFGNNLTPGFRGDIGRYFANGAFGIGGRFWIIAEDDDAFALSGNGSDQSIGRPFFNTSALFQGEDGVFVGFDDGFSGFEGSVSGEASLNILAAEAYGRLNLGSGRAAHVDLIGGYSFFRIDDDLAIRSTTIGPLPGPGNITSFSDSFSARNEFHGGQIGAETTLRRGRWVARSLSKVHLGNMNQRVAISGQSSEAIVGVPGVVNYDQGLLSGGNSGVYERDAFAFAPEMNLKLGYQFRDHVTFSVGYSFIYWNHVALAGQQIDRNIEFDGTLPAGGNAPNFRSINDGGFWVQGLDLGMTIEF